MFSGLALLVSASAFFASAAGAPVLAANPTTIHPNGDHTKCLDVKGNLQANGTAVQIFDCNGTGAQQWVISPGSTTVKLNGTNFCLDAGHTPANNIQAKIWQCFDKLPAQSWFYTGDKRVAVEGKGQCLDLTNGNHASGTPVQTYKCTDFNTNQIWTLE